MKKRLITLSLMSLGFILCSCEGNKTSTSVESSTPATNDTTSNPISENISDNVTSEEKDSEETRNWTDSDIASMKKYLNGFTGLPFPIDITETYVDASGTDTDGECFIIVDSKAEDISTSYGTQLTKAGFTFDGTEEDDYGIYHYYYIQNGEDLIYVQLDYYMEDFELFAWIQTDDSDAEIVTEFPYSEIKSHFNLTTNIDEKVIPSFELAANKGYDFYASGSDYYCVGGYFDSTITDETYTANYEKSLSNLKYIVDSTNAVATNADLGFKVEYMAYSSYFFIQVSLYNETTVE